LQRKKKKAYEKSLVLVEQALAAEKIAKEKAIEQRERLAAIRLKYSGQPAIKPIISPEKLTESEDSPIPPPEKSAVVILPPSPASGPRPVNPPSKWTDAKRVTPRNADSGNQPKTKK